MKGTKSLFALLAVGAVAISANAATATKSKKTAKLKTTSQNQMLVAQAAPTDAPATMSAAAPGATSSTSLAAAVAPAKPRTIKAEFYTESSLGVKSAEQREGTTDWASYAGIKKDLGDGDSVSIRQMFTYKSAASSEKKGEFHTDPLQINYTKGKLATFSGDGVLTGIARIYLPTDELSRNQTKSQGSFRGYLVGAKSFAKLDLSYALVGQYYNWTQDTYTDASGNVIGNRQLRFWNELDAFYNVNEKFAPGIMAGVETSRRRPVIEQRANWEEQLYLDYTLQFSPIKNVVAQFYVEDKVEIQNPSESFRLFRDTNMSYNVNLSITM